MAAGWDHSPGMSDYGSIGPRVCPRCDLSATVRWVLRQDPDAALTDAQRAVLDRIAGEPESLAVDES